MGQAFRPSQFILTYGIGSIIEASHGPRLIPSFDKWDHAFTIFRSSGHVLKRIIDSNASAQLNGGEIFELPTNPDYDLPADTALFKTMRFPHWALCQKHKILYRLGKSGQSNCPSCIGMIGDSQAEAIRFVRACPNGHLDDVNWSGAVHKGKKNCNGDTFNWIEDTGSDLKDVRIRCRKCNSEVSLLDIYYYTSNCSGYFPEEDYTEACNEVASVVLRSATSLRIAEVISSLTIPPRALRIHSILLIPEIHVLLPLVTTMNNPKENLINNLRTILKQYPNMIDPATMVELEKTPNGEVESAIKDIIDNPSGFKSPMQVKEEEFEALNKAAGYGYPHRPSMDPLFEVDKSAVIQFAHPSGLRFRVTPIKRLQVIMAQKGYRRPVRGPNCKLIERYHVKDGKKLYPGVKLKGEGIFIDLPDVKNLKLDDVRVKMWKDKMDEALKQGREDAYLYHPLFVWWHTLAHRLIIGLSVDSGYSSAAIRESVFQI